MSEVNKGTFVFIVNPQAGRGKFGNLEATLRHHLGPMGITYEIQTTSERYHATDLARRAADKFDVVVAVGGDGTVHEVANGLVGTKACMSVLPMGSGNDFGHLLGIPSSIDRALHAIKGGTVKLFDVGEFQTSGGIEHVSPSKYFINSFGIGLDAAIAQEARRISKLKGLAQYFVATLRTLQWYRGQSYQVGLDGVFRTSRLFLICVGNGDREGGGFRVTPDARPDDGKFQVCMVDEMPVLRALRVLPLAMRGVHGNAAGIDLVDATLITVRSDTKFIAHADGEIVGTDLREVTIRLLPKALRVVVPA
ncbi:MAG: diacylglycerol kinase family protein [Bacteroidota bacterium]